MKFSKSNERFIILLLTIILSYLIVCSSTSFEGFSVKKLYATISTETCKRYNVSENSEEWGDCITENIVSLSDSKCRKEFDPDNHYKEEYKACADDFRNRANALKYQEIYESESKEFSDEAPSFPPCSKVTSLQSLWTKSQCIADNINAGVHNIIME